MASNSTTPGFYALPGQMSPGFILPGTPFEPSVPAGNTLLFFLGDPHFGWLTGSPVTAA